MTSTTRFRPAVFAVASLAFAGSAFAQLGPIEPTIIPSLDTSRALTDMPDLADDYVVPVEVTVAADGHVKEVVVSTSSGEPAADETARAFILEKTFLPGLDASGHPVESKAIGSVEVHSKTDDKELRANMKLVNVPAQVARVRKLKCRDFTWEVARLRTDGRSPDVSQEAMPWVSLRIYMLDRKVPKEMESPLIDKWPRVFGEAEASCQAHPDKNYLTDVLAPLLGS